ncbi:MAG TPA: urease accessory UreF family protein, partial [Chthoniobacterales bacterium]|nr:urease accessory UreF family protein [Chthoniobacterales bacterium]
MPVINELSGALQLASPALPIGSFSYSQGLETAVELWLVNDEQAAKEWIGAGLTEIVGRCDAPVMISIFRSCAGESEQELGRLNSWYLATRESFELLEETLQMGWSLLKLANALHWIDPQNPVNQLSQVAFPTAFAASAVALGLSEETALTAFCFGWLESQVLASMKLIPLGQVAGHRVLADCRAKIGDVVNS